MKRTLFELIYCKKKNANKFKSWSEEVAATTRATTYYCIHNDKSLTENQSFLYREEIEITYTFLKILKFTKIFTRII